MLKTEKLTRVKHHRRRYGNPRWLCFWAGTLIGKLDYQRLHLVNHVIVSRKPKGSVLIALLDCFRKTQLQKKNKTRCMEQNRVGSTPGLRAIICLLSPPISLTFPPLILTATGSLFFFLCLELISV